MTTGLSWEEVTLAKLHEALKEKEKVDIEAERLSRFIRALQDVLEIDKQRRGINVNGQHGFDPEQLRTKSVREALIEIAARNNGTITAKEAVQVLIQAGFYEEAKQARDTVYSTLRRSKKDFRKVRPGVFHLISSRVTGEAG